MHITYIVFFFCNRHPPNIEIQLNEVTNVHTAS